MHTKRIIPCLDVKDGRVVKGVNFINLRDAGDPAEVAAAYDREGADEVVFLDITASADARSTQLAWVREVASKVFIPFTVGGGIRSVEDFRVLLREGADKISINSAAIMNPQLISDAARKFGSQCVVVAIDAKRRRSKDVNRKRVMETTGTMGSVGSIDMDARAYGTMDASRSEVGTEISPGECAEEDGWTVYKNGGRIDVGLDAVEWAREAERLGAGEILLTSMDGDGTKAGYDLELTRAVSSAVSIPVIASGGAGREEHFYEALTEGGAEAALAASLFHYKELEIRQVKRYLRDLGVAVRL